MTREEKMAVDAFAKDWREQEGYDPAPFQKAIALQRLRRGQKNAEIIAALAGMRV